MKIRQLFDENLKPNWGLIWSLEPFRKCLDINQNKDWHREMLNQHIEMVTSKMYDAISGNSSFIGEDVPVKEKLMLMTAALCHDLGKATTTKWDDGIKQWKCKNHGAVGEKITRKLFFDEPDIYLRESVCWLVRYHMTLHNVDRNNPEEIEKRIGQLAYSWGYIRYEDIAELYACDCMGSLNEHNDKQGFLEDIAFVRDCKKYYDTKKESLDENYEYCQNKTKAIVMVGIAGSGKSTVAEEYAALGGYKIISRDTIREELGMVSKDKKYKGNKSQEDKVTKVFNERLLQYARNGVPFIIDNMNLQERYRKGYRELLKDYDLFWLCRYIEAPTIEECKRRRHGMIPENEIDRMMDRLEIPRPYEFDNVQLYKQWQASNV